MTVSEALKATLSTLREAAIDSSRIDSELILCQVMGFTRVQLITREDTLLTSKQEEELATLTKRRLTHEPMQYILGHCEFMGLDFKVNRHTLIPRGDTECLVERVLKYIRDTGAHTVLDIGTGTGAIAISLAALGDAYVTAVDISQGALEVAKENVGLNQVEDRVTLLESDLFNNVQGAFDIIVSNPPYIEREVIPTLEANVRDFEPISALDGGVDGLDFYRAIIYKCRDFLNSPGFIAFEIGYNQGERVKNLLLEAGFTHVEIGKDLSGLDRMVCGRLK